MPQKNNPQYLADMSFGFGEEDIIQPILEAKFGVLNKLDKYNMKIRKKQYSYLIVKMVFTTGSMIARNSLLVEVVDVIEVVMNIILWRLSQ